MNLSLKSFFDNLKENDQYSYFMYYRLYTNPKYIFMTSNNDKLYDRNLTSFYYNDKYFLKFLDLAYIDDLFYERLDYNIIREIHQMLCDISDNYEDKKEINSIIRRTETLIKCIYKKTIEPKNKRESLYRLIENDDYNGVDYYLNKFVYTPEEVVNILTCNNNFLDLIENKIINGNLDRVVIDNIINILYKSIELKMSNYSTDKDFINNIPNTEIKEYDINRAKKLILELIKLRKNTKISYFYKHFVKNT